jgi:predicted metal-dependent peptidase
MAKQSVESEATFHAPEEFKTCYSAALSDLLRYDSFYARVLLRLYRVVTREVPTLAVGFRSGRPCLFINPDFFLQELTTKTRPAVLKHEALHIILNHITRDLGRGDDPVLANLAMDVLVNQKISPWKLPEDGVFLQSFPDLFWNEGKSADFYYDHLADLKQAMVEASNGRWPADAEGPFDWSGLFAPLSALALQRLYPQPEKRDVLPLHAELENTPGGDPGQEGAESGSESLPGSCSSASQPTGLSTPTDDGSRTIPAQSLSESGLSRDAPSRASVSDLDRAMQEAAINRLVQPAPGSYVPESIRREITTKSTLNWKTVLRHFLAKGRTVLQGTSNRYSKRFREVETTPVHAGQEGHSYKRIPPTGMRLRRVARILAAIDVSGSITTYGDKLLATFWEEVRAAWQCKVDIDVALFNDEIVRVNEFRGRIPEDYTEVGGGNDNGECVIRHLRRNRSKSYAGCIVLTDAGFDQTPIEVRAPCPLVWLVVQQPYYSKIEFEQYLQRLPGRKIILPKNEDL